MVHTRRTARCLQGFPKAKVSAQERCPKTKAALARKEARRQEQQLRGLLEELMNMTTGDLTDYLFPDAPENTSTCDWVGVFWDELPYDMVRLPSSECDVNPPQRIASAYEFLVDEPLADDLGNASVYDWMIDLFD